ncbi:MAG TPA: aspartate kinase [Pyrinomonadaceae bacterium]|nr:aspartate kinase [Pyrinomonadaceae bacterium]
MNKNLQVMKFGGTSVGDAARIRGAAEIVAAAARRGAVVAVVSAMGGVTNALVGAARDAACGDAGAGKALREALHARHAEAVEALIPDGAARAALAADTERIIEEVATLCQATATLRELTPRALDAISSAGERLSARLMAGALVESGTASVALEATELIVTDDEHGRATPLMDETRGRANERLLPLLEGGTVPVVTGFIGATGAGVLTTLGRGGSDYSATIIGAALGAAEITIWTDVDGVMTADPRLVEDARTIGEISYAEAAELAYFGAKVLHPKTLRPVAEAGVPVWIRNSFAPEKSGTRITPAGRPSSSGVRAITAISNVSMITVGGGGIVDVLGIAARTFAAAASARANVLMISQASSQNDICFVVDTCDAGHTVEALRRTFAADLAHRQVDHINVDSEIAVVAVVGENMRGTTGIAGRLFSALGRRGVNIIAIAQGSSEYNVSFVVAASAMRDAMTAAHHEFNLHRRESRFDAGARELVGV